MHANGITVTAKLDLSDANHRCLFDLIRRSHTGRWPTFRCLGMRQSDGVIYEAVEWLRMARPSFSVVIWRPDGLGLSWRDQSSQQEAMKSLRKFQI